MQKSRLTKDQFREWRKDMGWTQKFAAEKLGLSRSAIFLYETGKRENVKIPIPKIVALAMNALRMGLKPYGDI